jgi:hypothetical protein
MIKEGISNVSPLLDNLSNSQLYRLEELKIEIDISASKLDDLSNMLSVEIEKKIRQTLQLSDNYALKSKKELVTPNQSLEEGFLHFLKNGTLPWYIKTLKTPIFKNTSSIFKQQLSKLLTVHHEAKRRLVFQFEDETVYLIIELLKKADSTVISIIREMAEIIQLATGRVTDRFGAGNLLKKNFLKIVIQEIFSKDNSFIKRKDFFERALMIFLSEVASKNWFSFDKFSIAFKEQLLHHNIDFVPQLNLNLKEEESNSKIPTTKKVPFNAIMEEDFEDLKENEIRYQIPNGGIVLLHPFLSRFFEKLGLMEHGKFRSSNCQQRAVCLIHYLATGENRFEEQKMIFPKFICNYPLSQTVPIDLPVSEYEKTEANSLLDSIIEHWDALKNTSIDGIRVNFLQRKALLIKESPGYSLYVENDTIDILMDRLPWNISIVKWSWNPNLLTVKWR